MLVAKIFAFAHATTAVHLFMFDDYPQVLISKGGQTRSPRTALTPQHEIRTATRAVNDVSALHIAAR